MATGNINSPQEKRRMLNILLERMDHIVELCGWEYEGLDVTDNMSIYRRQFHHLQRQVDVLTKELGL